MFNIHVILKTRGLALSEAVFVGFSWDFKKGGRRKKFLGERTLKKLILSFQWGSFSQGFKGR